MALVAPINVVMVEPLKAGLTNFALNGFCAPDPNATEAIWTRGMICGAPEQTARATARATTAARAIAVARANAAARQVLQAAAALAALAATALLAATTPSATSAL